MSGKEGMFPAPIPTAKLRNYYKSPNHMRPNPLQMPCGAVLVNFDEPPPVEVVPDGKMRNRRWPRYESGLFREGFQDMGEEVFRICGGDGRGEAGAAAAFDVGCPELHVDALVVQVVIHCHF